MNTIPNSLYYCSQKFWWQSVDLPRLQSLSCCAATPQVINISHLSTDSGNLFNSEEIMQERIDMLNEIPVASCKSCWDSEAIGAKSRRQWMNTTEKTHTAVVSSPEHIGIILNSKCSMSCVYCCKQYSSAWRKDIARNGDYHIRGYNNRYVNTAHDIAIDKVSSNQITNSSAYTTILNAVIEVIQSGTVKSVDISGGEPLLSPDLVALLEDIPNAVRVNIYTGLGVTTSYLSGLLSKIAQYSNVSIVVSAENIEDRYEFTRYGNTWNRFIKNIAIIRSCGIHFSFNSTITNLTIGGVSDFATYFANEDIVYSTCADPDFLAPFVLPEITKLRIDKDMNIPSRVKEVMHTIPSTSQIENFQAYLTEYAARRNLDISIYDSELSKW